jgi:hypothetical protein
VVFLVSGNEKRLKPPPASGRNKTITNKETMVLGLRRT